MGHEMYLYFQECFNVNVSKGCGKRGHEKSGAMNPHERDERGMKGRLEILSE